MHDVDLAQLHPALVKTRLAGFLKADIDGARQALEGDVAQASLTVAFAASYADRHVDITRFRARAGGGTLSGSGHVALDGPRAFDVALLAPRVVERCLRGCAREVPARHVPGVLTDKLSRRRPMLPSWSSMSPRRLTR